LKKKLDIVSYLRYNVFKQSTKENQMMSDLDIQDMFKEMEFCFKCNDHTPCGCNEIDDELLEVLKENVDKGDSYER
jgi:hypothetical protein